MLRGRLVARGRVGRVAGLGRGVVVLPPGVRLVARVGAGLAVGELDALLLVEVAAAEDEEEHDEADEDEEAGEDHAILVIEREGEATRGECVSAPELAGGTKRHVQEGIQDAEEDDDAAQPEMDPAKLCGGLRLAVLGVVEEAEYELANDEGDDDEPEDLVIVAEPARLGCVIESARNSTLCFMGSNEFSAYSPSGS